MTAGMTIYSEPILFHFLPCVFINKYIKKPKPKKDISEVLRFNTKQFKSHDIKCKLLKS